MNKRICKGECKTTCLDCKEKPKPDEVTMPRWLAEKLFKRCVDDKVRAEIVKYL